MQALSRAATGWAARLSAHCKAGAHNAQLRARHPPGQARQLAADSVAQPRAPKPPSAMPDATAGGGARWSRWLLFIPPGVAAILGKWQLDRRRWKIDLLERREAELQGEPVDLFALGEPPSEYTRVRARGEYDYAATQWIGPRPRTVMGTTQLGYLVVTPLHNKALGKSLMVCRGWAPKAWREDAAAQEAAQQPGQVAVEGVVRLGETPNQFVPDNDPSAGAWYYISPRQLAAGAGLPPDAPYVELLSIDEQQPVVSSQRMPTTMDVLGGRTMAPRAVEAYPLPKSAGDLRHFAVMPADHRNYAATWFTLSGATGLLALRAVRSSARR